MISAGSRAFYAPIDSNLPDYDNYFCRDCRRIVHVREGSPGFRVPDAGMHAGNGVRGLRDDGAAEDTRRGSGSVQFALAPKLDIVVALTLMSAKTTDPNRSATALALIGLGGTLLAVVMRPGGTATAMIAVIGTALILIGLWRASHIGRWRLRLLSRVLLSLACLGLIFFSIPALHNPPHAIANPQPVLPTPPLTAPTAMAQAAEIRVVIHVPVECTSRLSHDVERIRQLLSERGIPVSSMVLVAGRADPQHAVLRFFKAEDEQRARDVSTLLIEHQYFVTLESFVRDVVSKNAAPHQLELWLTCAVNA